MQILDAILLSLFDFLIFCGNVFTCLRIGHMLFRLLSIFCVFHVCVCVCVCTPPLPWDGGTA